MKQRAHLLGLLVVTLLVGGGYLRGIEGTAAVCVGVVLGGTMVSFLAERAEPPRSYMKPGAPMRLAHLVLMLDKLITASDRHATVPMSLPIYLQQGVTFAPAGSLFIAQLDGQRTLVLDIAKETPDGAATHAQGTLAASPATA